MSLVKADDACPQVRFGVSIIPTDVRDGSNAPVEHIWACRLHPRLRTYGCDAANRRFGPARDVAVVTAHPCISARPS